MKKIIFSLAAIVLTAGVAITATTAYFSDTEKSIGNTFTAGSLDLKIDSTAHFNSMVCVCETPGICAWEAEPDFDPGINHYPQPGDFCDGTWEETDLGGHKFFSFTDLKPGDEGENTLSLHVTDNDAWGQFTITGVSETGGICTEPETEVEIDEDCYLQSPSVDEQDGELRENVTFSFWLDQGSIPGFQNNEEVDSEEGDNIWQSETEPLLSGVVPFGQTGTDVSDGIIELEDEVHDLWEALSATYTAFGCDVIDGRTDYGRCHGLAADGRLVGSAVYYFGMAWQLPYEVGNEAQSDGFIGDMKFEVVQHRNNPNHTF